VDYCEFDTISRYYRLFSTLDVDGESGILGLIGGDKNAHSRKKIKR